jgi:fluoride exporter
VNIVSIAIGGMLGAVLRFWTGVILFSQVSSFPWPTLIVNVTGSFLLGWFVEYGSKKLKNQKVILGIQTGFLGSFTTFSTFSVELIHLVDGGRITLAAVYFTASLILGLAAAALGMKTNAAFKKEAGVS